MVHLFETISVFAMMKITFLVSMRKRHEHITRQPVDQGVGLLLEAAAEIDKTSIGY